MVVKVLGPLDTGTEPLSPRERTMLSALVVRSGSTVAAAELADAWWGDAPPRTWEQQVRNSIARIRARLGRGSIETLGVEYRLGLDPDAIDAVRFERLVSTARAHRLRGEHDRAVDAYTRALAMWRGSPLQDVTDWEPGVAEALRLVEIRASAEEELLDARLDAGEHRALIADAERLLREEPLREDRWSILALANYRADRQAEALALLRAARERLADELGIEPGPRLAGLEIAMLRRDPELDAPAPATTATSTCPYPGLLAFGPEDADVFFGRETDTEAVLERILPGAVVAIAGASGTGKSSLLLAGVVPRVRARGRTVEIVRPGSGGVDAVERGMQRAGLLAIDQAEELLGRGTDELERFGALARAFLDGGGTIVVTIRSDALDRIRALPLIGDDIGRGVYLLGPLTDAAYRAAIEEPARTAGLRVEPGLVELAVRDAGDRSSTLPHLSHAMQETWNRREGATLTVEGYRLAGGILGGIAQSAEDAFRTLSIDDQSVCRSLLMRLVERSADGSSTRRRVAVAPLLADAPRRRVLEQLTRARLVTVDQDAATVAHEAVASAWPRLDGWLEEDAEGARTLRAVESAAAAWDSGGRDDDDLLRGARLHSALAWRDAARPDLTPVEAELLTASEDHELRELRSLSERAGRDRRRNRVLGTALAGSAVLLVAAIVAGSLAAVRGQEAAEAAENARIEALVATSLAIRTSDPEAAALLAAEAHRRWPQDARVRSALLGVVASAGGHLDTHRVAGASRMAMAVIPGTATALRVRDGEAGTAVEIVDVASGDVERTLTVDVPEAWPRQDRTANVSSDGRIAAIQTPRAVDPEDPDSCCWNHIAFVDLDRDELLGGTQLLRMRTSERIDLGEDGAVGYLSHPITGDLVAIDTRTGVVRASSPDVYADYTRQPGRYGAITVVDDDTVATAVSDRVRLYDRRTLALTRSVPIPADGGGLALAADGSGGLVSNGNDAMVRVDPAEGAVTWVRSLRPKEVCYRILITSRGTIVCAELGDVTEWDLATGESTGRSIVTQLDSVAYIGAVDDATILVAVSLNALWMRWRIDDSGAGKRAIAAGHVINGDPDVDGDLIATNTLVDGEMRMALWSISDDAPRIEADGLSLIGPGIVERYDEGEGWGLMNVHTGERYPYRIPGLPDDFWLSGGGWGRHAFVGFDDQIVAFDPATGRAVGEPMRLGSRLDGLLSVSESPDETRAVVSWWDADAAVTETAVFDIGTGAIVSRGLYNVDGSVAVSSDELVAIGDETVQRYSLDTLEPLSNLPRASSGSMQVMVSADGRTLLNIGARNRLNLYDLTSDIVLADPIDADFASDVHGGQLSADGMTLFTNATDGILMWTLDPAAQAVAACALAGRELTPQEWTTYFPDEPQIATCAELGS